MSTRSFSFSNDNPLSTEAVLVNASSSRYEVIHKVDLQFV